VTIDIDPVLVHAGPLMVGWYGLVVAIAIVVGLWLALREARRKGLPSDRVESVAYWVILGGIVGARALHVIEDVGNEFGKKFGRSYGLLETFHCDDAEDILVTSGTVASTARGVVEERRALGEKVGLVRVRAFRPFPKAALRAALGNAKRVAVIDRNISYGHHGIFHQETKSALFDMPRRPKICGFIAGLGGRDITPSVLEAALHGIRNGAEDSQWLGLSASVAQTEKEISHERR